MGILLVFNSNMRCIEAKKRFKNKIDKDEFNSNMRCIEASI